MNIEKFRINEFSYIFIVVSHTKYCIYYHFELLLSRSEVSLLYIHVITFLQYALLSATMQFLRMTVRI